MVLTHGKPILVTDGTIFMERGHYIFLNLSSREVDRAKQDLGVGILSPFLKKEKIYISIWGQGMEYILLTFASEDNAEMILCVISVNPSNSTFAVKFLFLSPTRTLSMRISILGRVSANSACPEGSQKNQNLQNDTKIWRKGKGDEKTKRK